MGLERNVHYNSNALDESNELGYKDHKRKLKFKTAINISE